MYIVCMNTLPIEDKVRILSCLTEGMAIRATSRITGASKNTIRNLIREVGAACERFHEAHVRNLPTLKVQCDEVWSFVAMKQRQVPQELQGVHGTGIGSVWTWTALDADSKLMIAWVVGDRDQRAADRLIAEVKARTSMRVQITTDGFTCYMPAIMKSFRYGEADYAELVKVYSGVNSSAPKSSAKTAEGRYSPGRLLRTEKHYRIGYPLTKNVSTSYVERSNLTIRMQNRRFTRLTNGFSKHIEMHRYALAITFFHYNFVRKHQSLGGRTPAMAATIVNHPFTVRDMLFIADQCRSVA
jgi:IS1 family transposase